MQTGNKKMRDLRTGDVFVRDGVTYVAIAEPYYGTVWVTKPELVNESGVYSYTSAALLQYEQDDEAEVIGKDERPLKMFVGIHLPEKRSNRECDFTGSYLSSHSLFCPLWT